jgi:hypothetical protein
METEGVTREWRQSMETTKICIDPKEENGDRGWGLENGGRGSDERMETEDSD